MAREATLGGSLLTLRSREAAGHAYIRLRGAPKNQVVISIRPRFSAPLRNRVETSAIGADWAPVPWYVFKLMNEHDVERSMWSPLPQKNESPESCGEESAGLYNNLHKTIHSYISA